MTLVEICVDDLAGTLDAERAGAARVEVCASLAEGGITPSFGLISRVPQSVTTLGVQIMIRPRGGDFVYSASEISVMLADIRAVRDLAAPAQVPVGVVFGALTSAGDVDIPATRDLIAAADGMPVTFHKAFDVTRDLLAAHAVLTDLGVRRILTSGGAATALAGAPVLRELASRGPHAPIILAGGSVRAQNAARLVAATGVAEVHLRAQSRGSRTDAGLVTDAAIVRAVIDALDERPAQ